MRQESAEYEAFLEKSTRVQLDINDIQFNISRTMEYTRLKYGFSIRDFSKMLGMSNNSYQKILDRGSLKLRFFLTFCLVFGYDITDLVAIASNRASIHPRAREFAGLFDGLSADTMDAVKQTISLSDESQTTKSNLSASIDSLIEMRKNRT